MQGAPQAGMVRRQAVSLDPDETRTQHCARANGAAPTSVRRYCLAKSSRPTQPPRTLLLGGAIAGWFAVLCGYATFQTQGQVCSRVAAT